MIIVKLQGGLGNQLFQYAFGRALSLHYKTKLYFDTTIFNNLNPDTHTYRPLYPNRIGLKIQQASKEQIRKFKSRRLSLLDRINLKFKGNNPYKNLYEEPGVFHDKVFNTSSNLYLDGYWQSCEYFVKYRDYIAHDIQLPPHSFKQLKPGRSVFIHIRRGDYLSDLSANKFHGVLNVDYYIQAMEIIRKVVKNPIFFFFSDDIEWVKSQFNLIDEHYFLSNPDNDEINEFAAMTACDHAIVANSSFSWWAAWLIRNPEKIIIAPKQWFQSIPNNDYYIPSEWIRL